MARLFARTLAGLFMLLPLQAWAGMSVEGFSSSGPLSQETLESQYSAPSNFDYLNNLPAAPAARVQQLRGQGLSDSEISEQLVQEVQKKMHKLRREENPDYEPGVSLTAGQDRAEVRHSIQLRASGGIEDAFQYRVTEGRCAVTSNGLITASAAGTCMVQAYEVWLNDDTGARREYTSPTLSLEFYDPCPEEIVPLALASGTSRLVVGETTQISAEGGTRALYYRQYRLSVWLPAPIAMSVKAVLHQRHEQDPVATQSMQAGYASQSLPQPSPSTLSIASPSRL